MVAILTRKIGYPGSARMHLMYDPLWVTGEVMLYTINSTRYTCQRLEFICFATLLILLEFSVAVDTANHTLRMTL